MQRPARFGIRAAAAGVDFTVGLAAAFIFRSSIGMFFANRAVVTLRIGETDTWWKGPLPLMLGAFGEFVYLLPLALFVVWMLDPLTGATIGKRVFGLRVRGTDGQPVSPHTRWFRTLLQTAGLWGWTLALLTGLWQVAVLASLAGALILIGFFAALGRTSLTLHDRLSGTSVYIADHRGQPNFRHQPQR